MSSPHSPPQSIKDEHEDLWTPSALAMPIFSLSPAEWPAEWSTEDTPSDSLEISKEFSKEMVDEMSANILKLEEQVEQLKRLVNTISLHELWLTY
jgi:hypothetical protein